MARGYRLLSSATVLIGVCLVIACRSEKGDLEEREPADSAIGAIEENPVVVTSPRNAYTEAQAGRGRIVFQDYCTFCHEEDLSGLRGPPLSGPTFIERWSAPNLTLNNLYSFVSTSMPEDQPGVLESEQYIDVLAYILQANGYPAGDRVLTAESSVLRTIAITPQR